MCGNFIILVGLLCGLMYKIPRIKSPHRGKRLKWDSEVPTPTSWALVELLGPLIGFGSTLGHSLAFASRAKPTSSRASSKSYELESGLYIAIHIELGTLRPLFYQTVNKIKKTQIPTTPRDVIKQDFTDPSSF